MKYYVVTIQNDSAQIVHAHNNVDDALAEFHSELAYHAEGRDSTLCMIFDSNGGFIKNEMWVRNVAPSPVE